MASARMGLNVRGWVLDSSVLIAPGKMRSAIGKKKQRPRTITPRRPLSRQHAADGFNLVTARSYRTSATSAKPSHTRADV